MTSFYGRKNWRGLLWHLEKFKGFDNYFFDQYIVWMRNEFKILLVRETSQISMTEFTINWSKENAIFILILELYIKSKKILGFTCLKFLQNNYVLHFLKL